VAAAARTEGVGSQGSSGHWDHEPVTLVSAVLTVVDGQVAYAGAIVNLVILAAVLLGPRVATWFGW
jgi:hypothetical protein